MLRDNPALVFAHAELVVQASNLAIDSVLRDSFSDVVQEKVPREASE